MKKNYEKPEIEAIELEVEDIIQTSGVFTELSEFTDSDGSSKVGGTVADKVSDWL